MNNKNVVDFDRLPEIGKWILSNLEMKQIQEALPSSYDGRMEIAILINGKEVGFSFQQFSEEIERQLNRMISEEAKIMVENEYSELISVLQDAQEKFRVDWSK